MIMALLVVALLAGGGMVGHRRWQVHRQEQACAHLKALAEFSNVYDFCLLTWDRG